MTLVAIIPKCVHRIVPYITNAIELNFTVVFNLCINSAVLL